MQTHPGGGADGRGGEPVEGDGQVVASARALMRYRRNRATTTDGSVEKSWASGDPNAATAGQTSGAPRVTLYQNPTKAPQVGRMYLWIYTLKH